MADTTSQGDGPPLLMDVLRRGQEDTVTEVIAWLLREPSSANLMLDALFGEMAPEQPPEAVHTQVVAPDGGRPDLMLEWPKERWFIEVKFSAGLTDRQESAYQESISSPDRLFFLLPTSRIEELREKQKGVAVEVGEITWETLLGRLDGQIKTGKPSPGSRARFWVEELMAAVLQEAKLATKHHPFSVEEVSALNPVSGEALANALDLVDDIVQRIEDGMEAFKNVGQANTAHKEGLSYGLTIKRGPSWESGWIWFGFWMMPWRQRGHGPIWIQCGPAEQFTQLEEDAEVLVEKISGKTLLIPLELSAGEQPRETVKAALTLLERVAKAHEVAADK